MKTSFTLSVTFPAPPAVVFRAWMSSTEHGAMTGSPAKIDARLGGKFTAWDGYISGKTLELAAGRRVVQAWRTTEFPTEAPDSRLEVRFDPSGTGTKLLLTHSNIPPDQVESYRSGWEESYFGPMREYFSGRAS